MHLGFHLLILSFFTTPFPDTFTKTIKISEDQPTSRPNCFGFIFDTDGLNQRVFVSEILNKSDASSLLTSKTQRANILGAYIVAINESPIFTCTEAIDKLVSLHQDGASSFTITFGKQKQLTSKEFSQALLDLELEPPSPATPSPEVDLDEDHIPSISIDDIRHITALRFDDIS